MSDFSSTGPIGSGVNGSLGPVNRMPATGPAAPLGSDSGSPKDVTASAETNRVADADRVELSDRARFLDMLRQLPIVRQDLINQVRQAIASGTYETDDKLNAAIDNLMRDEM